MASQSFDQYGISAAERNVLLQQAAARAARRQEYLKTVSNPFIRGHEGGPAIFDTALQRFHSMETAHYDFFKPNVKTAKWASLVIIAPMLILGYVVHKERSEREHKIRTGQISYRDRKFKLI